MGIEEVDSSTATKAEAPKAKKKIAIEEVDSSCGSSSSSVGAVEKPQSGVRSVPAALSGKTKQAPKTGYEFERVLDKCKSQREIAEYMNLIKPAGVPKLLRQNLTSEIIMMLMGGIDA